MSSGREQPRLIDLATAVARIQAADRIVITTHARADGDAIGSCAGLHRVLTGQDKRVSTFVHEPVQSRYAFLPGTGELQVWRSNQAADILATADLLLLLDTCAESQLGEVAVPIAQARLRKLAIDHHVTRDPIVDELLLDDSAGACAQILAHLCEQADWPIDAEAAALFCTGLATDTGWFRFSNTGAAEFAAAARLVELGARPNELYERLHLDDPEPRVRLIGAVLSSFELLADGRLAVMRITREMLARCGATHEMTGEIINEPQQIGSVVACVLFAEPEDDGPVRVSFRSKRGLDVAAVARSFGGGGHTRAAGVRMDGTLEEVYAKVVPAMVRGLEEAERATR